MPSCREVDPLFAPYVDGEATPGERAIVDAHLLACPKCRHHTALQTAVRSTVREKLCRPCAPEALRTRCRAAARAGAGPFGISYPSLRSLSIAAALVIVTGGVLMYGLSGLPTVLAAQLTLDHVACFTTRAADESVDVSASEERFARDYGEQVRLPRLSTAGLRLVNLRRCYYGEGPAAHAMYRLNGRPVSLYVIPAARHDRTAADVFGHDAIFWSRGNTTYVLLANEPRATLESLAMEMERGL